MSATPFKDNQIQSLSMVCPICGKLLVAKAKSRLTSWLFQNSDCKCAIVPSMPLSHLNEADKKELDDSAFNGQNLTKVDLGDRYSVLSCLGKGGNAIVYKVHDLKLDKTFAVKVLNAELSENEAARQRFNKEIEAASNLTHANLVAIYDHGVTANHTPYLVMDCLEGQTLEEALKQEKHLPPARALNIFIQICEALVHMHMKGIVHRDLKPSNIFLIQLENELERVKIVDFGIAKIQPCLDGTQFTQVSELLGSPAYMSSEQCMGEHIDHRTDIYSLGSIMYETLTGRNPYYSANPIKCIINHLENEAELFDIEFNHLKISRALEKVVLKCLNRDPAFRYQAVSLLLRDLEKVRK